MTAARKAARAVADVTQGTIIAVVEIEATPDVVFDAITDPNALVQWWGSPDTYQVTKWNADLRVGGKWRSDGRSADGSDFSVEGEFLEIEKPRRLVQTWCAPWDGGNTTTIRYQLDTIPGGTRVTLRHEGFAGRPQSCEGHAEGWERVLEWMGAWVMRSRAAPASKFFLCRLLAPRPTFMFDLNEDEKKVMQAHSAYWREKAKAGIAVLFGPVADPKGGWGVGIVEVPDEAAVRALEAGDPAITSNRGFQYEILPMLNAVLRPAR